MVGGEVTWLPAVSHSTRKGLQGPPPIDRHLPRYAYLPGRHPHPVRDVDGHTYDTGRSTAALSSDEAIRWGFDLFTLGYYWEAHEVWEEPWARSLRTSQRWTLMKGLILLAASGVKLRTGKAVAAARHARRSSSLLRQIGGQESVTFEALCGVTPSAIADLADEIAIAPDAIDAEVGALPASAPVFASLNRSTVTTDSDRKGAACLAPR